ncbi:hypothetical protein TSUD_65150 [Trifolium subterraneum]|uniref:F-box domain-containing protein n=1 Tax=Trifolium subterraneum TaxID=3900 RepID=A0A2Z6N0D0_TRISU|nr:hypothetical protein TSUD_65150 [Trifolium subterraneum]
MSNSAKEEIMIPPDTKRGRYHDQDRLSDLPDCVLLHILSFLNTKHVVQTCILSPRWKDLWKAILTSTTLTLHSSHFSTKKGFAKFAAKIITLRDTKTALHSLDLDCLGNIEPRLLKKILNYVDSHNTQIQQLAINVIADSDPILSCVSSCRALTSLKLDFRHKNYHGFGETLFPKSLDLPALTNLDLANFTFCASDNADCAEPFKAFNSLNSLTISNCRGRDARILRISNATLANLTLRHTCCADFTIIELSTPSLYTFSFYSTFDMKLCGSLSSVKQVDIDAQTPFLIANVLSWLQDFANVKSLTVTLITLQILSVFPHLLKVKHSLCNLKSLKVKVKGGVATSETIPDRIVDFLLQNSPTAEVDLIDH